MKKSRKPQKSSKKKARQVTSSPDQGRRNALRLLRNLALGGVALGGAGLFSVRAVQATIAEADLSRIGKGIPSVVQVHDPQCQLCTTLQRQTRKALKTYDESDVTYLVANIKTSEGSALAAQHGAAHVTLLFFDASGVLVDTLRGPTTAQVIDAAIARHIGG